MKSKYCLNFLLLNVAISMIVMIRDVSTLKHLLVSKVKYFFLSICQNETDYSNQVSIKRLLFDARPTLIKRPSRFFPMQFRNFYWKKKKKRNKFQFSLIKLLQNFKFQQELNWFIVEFLVLLVYRISVAVVNTA